ncbi:MAG: hypothetical protein EHM12_10510 [Dehalococcoidia bacterium]|nr:MAG: hypothetical protein EHM12_10510 [Dehalococcoidia bacterium]
MAGLSIAMNNDRLWYNRVLCQKGEYMPYIVVRLLQGMTIEQKRILVKDVTQVVAKDLNVPIQSVAMELEEYPPENISESEPRH